MRDLIQMLERLDRPVDLPDDVRVSIWSKVSDAAESVDSHPMIGRVGRPYLAVAAFVAVLAAIGIVAFLQGDTADNEVGAGFGVAPGLESLLVGVDVTASDTVGDAGWAVWSDPQSGLCFAVTAGADVVHRCGRDSRVAVAGDGVLVVAGTLRDDTDVVVAEYEGGETADVPMVTSGLYALVTSDDLVRLRGYDAEGRNTENLSRAALLGEEPTGTSTPIDVEPVDIEPFEPRAGHIAVWTGDEVLMVGGWPDTPYDSTNPPPMALGVDGSTRSLASPPETFHWFPGADAFWTGDRLIVVTGSRDPMRMVVLTYSPATDTWTTSRPLPTNGYLGGAVWTGSELLLVGGVLNSPDDQGWSYDPITDTWTQLPEPGISPVEGMRGVWTGTEAIFYGGYAGTDESPGVAWNPATRTWRALPSAGRDWIDNHGMVWTGDTVVVYSGHPDALLLYDPDTDAWTESAPIPITPAKRRGAAWTGKYLILWGGHAVYSDEETINQGALYDPTTNTWTIIADSPLTSRCDHSLTWTGVVAIVFGGIETCGQPNVVARGGAAAYSVAENEWRTLEP